MGWQDRDYGSEAGYYKLTGRRWLPALSRLSLSSMLIIANIAVFVLNSMMRRDPLGPLLKLGAMESGAVLEGQIWRLVTSQYLHFDTWHLFMNMLGLYFLGRYLEQHWGRRKFFFFYTICGIAGNLFFLLLRIVGWIGPSFAVGASGCILGVLGACAVLFPGIRLVLLVFPVKIRTAALLFVAVYVLNVVNKGINYGGDAEHLAGLAVGAGYAYWTRRSHGQVQAFRPVRVTRVAVQPTASTWTPSVLSEDSLEQEVDRILAKIREQGISSLTDSEKHTLAQASGKQ